MNFIEFRNSMFKFACFNINQVNTCFPSFDKNNLTRWQKKGYLVSLRQGYYAFSEYKGNADYINYFANRIYSPSYISLHTALAYYGIIPEAVIQITSVSTLKTTTFLNYFAEYSYKSVKEALFFGYDLKPLNDGRILQIAKPEKALIDLIYLYPFYNNDEELLNLRLDEAYLHDDLNKTLMQEYTEMFKSIALEKRMKKLINIYNL